MKIQFHNLVTPEFTPNLGVAYMHQYRAVMIALVFISITICWDRQLKK